MRTILRAAACAAVLFVSPRASEACGGFFCSQVPVLQTAERIVFEMSGGDEVTAYVQLQYQGNDPSFAWVVPVPSVPVVEVGVGEGMFDVLEAETRPVFDVAPAPEASADGVSSCGGGGFGGPPRLQVRSLPVPEVDVWKQETVGPFDYAVVSASRAEDLNDWLRINGYRVVPGSDPIVQAYLDEGMKLLALKLRQEARATQVEPVKLTYTDGRGCASIPLKLTAIAAVPGLEIVTWVFGPGRARSVNFADVEVDTSFAYSPADYERALGESVDAQGGGQGFVTEYAQPSLRLSARGDPVLQDLLSRHGWVTRLRTEIDPLEMTADPMFEIDPELPPVSNHVSLGAGRPAPAGASFVLLAVALVAARRWRR